MHWGSDQGGPSRLAAAAGTVRWFQIGQSGLQCLYWEGAHSLRLGTCNLWIDISINVLHSGKLLIQLSPDSLT